MHQGTALFAMATLAVAPFTGLMAQDAEGDLSYTYLEAGYANLDVDTVDDDEDFIEDLDDGGGFGFNGSFAFTENFFGFAGYSVTDSDATFVDESEVIFSSSQDAKRLELGLGMNFGIDPAVIGPSDLVLKAAYVDIDFDDFDFGGTDDPDIDDLNEDSSDGYYLDARLRSQLIDWLEGSLGVRYQDIEDSEEFSLVGNALFEFTQNVGVNLEFDLSDDVGYYLVGLRYSFDRF